MDNVVRYFYMAGDTENDIIWGVTPEDVIERGQVLLYRKVIERRVSPKGILLNLSQ